MRRHHGDARRQRLCHVAQVGGEREQSDHAEADDGDAAAGQHQQGVDVVPVMDVLHLLLLILLDQVAVLRPLRDLECIFVHLLSETGDEQVVRLLSDRITANRQLS